MSISKKATYALLADNVYWDVKKGFVDKKGTNEKDFTNSNWTPVPDGWKVIKEVSGSGDNRSFNDDTNGFTARAFQKVA